MGSTTGGDAGAAGPLLREVVLDPLVLDADSRLVAPELRRLYGGIRRRGAPGFHHLGVDEARRTVAAAVSLQGEPPVMHVTQDLDQDGLVVRLYRPTATADQLLVYLHGGGWVTGDLEISDVPARLLAEATGHVVASVAYPLSPESRRRETVPVVAQCLQTLAGARSRLGLDARRLALLGDSAGGHLALEASLLLPGAVDRLALLYPVVSPPGPRDVGSWLANADDPVLSSVDMRWFWAQYVGPQSPAGADLLAADLRSAPPTFVLTCGLDVLRDEGRALVARFDGAGAEVEHRELGGMMHGFLPMAGAVPRHARLALDLVSAWFAGRGGSSRA